MTTQVFLHPRLSYAPASRGKIVSAGPAPSLGVFRLPTDPMFFANLTLENIVVGSRYRITRADTGAELATGVAASTSEVVSGVPAYANPMLVNITVRKASGSPNYKIFDSAAYLVKAGTSAYILQQLDE